VADPRRGATASQENKKKKEKEEKRRKSIGKTTFSPHSPIFHPPPSPEGDDLIATILSIATNFLYFHYDI
jgi:hypothetical protein